MPSNQPPTMPERLHPLAKEILDELQNQPAAASFILGGGVALQHYCDYRDTRDIDAWWESQPMADAQSLLKDVMERVAKQHGFTLHMRNWGETQSYELQKGEQTVFSFQVAIRSVTINPPLQSAWPPVQIETLLDNLGAKMNALVNRGAPRDILDVFTVVERGLATKEELWAAWEQKNPGSELAAARANVLRRLTELEERLPLAKFTNPKSHDRALRVREWTRNILCHENFP